MRLEAADEEWGEEAFQGPGCAGEATDLADTKVCSDFEDKFVRNSGEWHDGGVDGAGDGGDDNCRGVVA